MPWQAQTPIMLECNAGQLCRRPYPGHKPGCPNYGTRETCPPKARRWNKMFRSDAKCVVIWTTFPFGKHVTKMQFKHPEWSKRQLECCLYWQGTARKELRAEVGRFVLETSEKWLVFFIPEAHGVNVTATMAALGHSLEWPPVHMTHHVAIAVAAKDSASGKA